MFKSGLVRNLLSVLSQVSWVCDTEEPSCGDVQETFGELFAALPAAGLRRLALRGSLPIGFQLPSQVKIPRPTPY